MPSTIPDLSYNLAASVHHHSLRTPDALAVAAEGIEISYGELAPRARNIAVFLRQSSGWSGASPTRLPRVAILGSRSIDACCAVLGAAWAGATYVPIGLKSPEERIVTILAQGEFSAVITDTAGAALLTERVRSACPPLIIRPAPHTSGVKRDSTFCLDHLPEADAAFAPTPIKATDLVYILFTSGTTGVPNGVMVSAGAVRHFIKNIVQILQYRTEDRSLDMFELSFDASVFSMFGIWEAGASLYLLPASKIMYAVKFARENRLTIWHSVPSLVSRLKQVHALSPGILPQVRLSLFGAEQLTLGSIETWVKAAPNSTIENLYGPTEATVACMHQLLPSTPPIPAKRDVVAIGIPLPGCEAAIFDASGSPVPDNEPGELAIAGPQLAEGYLHAARLTAEKFPVIKGVRWYRTGDLACRDEQGIFHHLGRIDNQVKIQGNRVELEDVDAHLRAAAGTELAACVAWPIKNGAAQGLIAFIAGPSRDADQIITALKTRVPVYMIPSQVVTLVELPLSLNGKVDRRALLKFLETPAQ